MRRILWIIGALVVVVLVAMQMHRPNFDLTPVDAAATLDAQLHPDAGISTTLHKACYNCHSAEARIPWYGHVWPTSQLIQNDVRMGRARLDFSNWANLSPEMSRIRLQSSCSMMQQSKMPLWYYRPMHLGAAPKAEEVAAFCNWVQSLPSEHEQASLR
jgi:hypothetical protein